MTRSSFTSAPLLLLLVILLSVFTVPVAASAAPAKTSASPALSTVALQGKLTAIGDYNCNASCDGDDPTTEYWAPGGRRYVCADGAWTAHENSSVWIELRYGPTCGAAWARVKCAACYITTTTILSFDQNNIFRVSFSTGGTGWTLMVDDQSPLSARACAWSNYSQTNSCTGTF